ncbi:hypothetical protein [Cohnella soli]|uniref:Uncharacterized protein n=1 Tax=Cohnella soli TaxID=425005 RepID=A0ABW0HPZ1_9BACL
MSGHIEEYVTISHNFSQPVSIMIGGKVLSGKIEEIGEEDCFLLAGKWHGLTEIEAIVT